MIKVQKSNQSYSTIYVRYSLYNNLFILGGGGGEDEGAIGGKTKKGGTTVKVCWSHSRGGALGYFLGGYVPPGTPNWHPILKKLSPKIDTPF